MEVLLSLLFYSKFVLLFKFGNFAKFVISNSVNIKLNKSVSVIPINIVQAKVSKTGNVTRVRNLSENFLRLEVSSENYYFLIIAIDITKTF